MINLSAELLQRCFFFFAFNVGIFFLCHSQSNFLGHYINFTLKVQPEVNFNETKLTEELYKKYSPVVKGENELKEFISMLVQGKKYYLFSNTQYENLRNAELYLEKISNRIYSNSDRPVRFKIIRDPSLNARAFEDGTIYINMGLLARYKNEAELAATLGHEIGHIVKKHSYKSYKAHKQYFKSTYFATIGSLTSLFETFVNTKSASNQLVDLEEESDKYSIELLKKSNFNTLALFSEQKIYLELENKHKKRLNYTKNNSVFYLKTHPSTKRRLNKVSKVSANNGRNFLIDSIFFMKLKKQAIDETINLYFEEQSFSNCIELAFVEHLKFPNDPFYLFYLTESTRRLINYDEAYEKLNFVTGIYKKDLVKKKDGNEQVYVMSNEKVVIAKKKEVNSILFKLVGYILQTDSNDFRSFKNSRLLNKDTLPFDTYADALNYFESVNTNNNYALNNLFLKDSCNNTNISEYEDDFCKLKKSIKEYSSKPIKDPKVLFVIYDLSHVVSEKGTFGDNNFTMIHNTSKMYYDEITTRDTEKKISIGQELEFSERSNLLNYLDLVYPLIKNQKRTKPLKNFFKLISGELDMDSLTPKNYAYFNFSLVTPELIGLLNKYNYKGVIFTSVSITDETRKILFGLGVQNEKWLIKHYYLDAHRNKIEFSVADDCSNLKSDFGSNDDNNDLFECLFQSIIRASN